MHYEIGDRLLVADPAGEPRHHLCRVVGSRGPDGSAPYVVLRYDTGTEELLDVDGEGLALVPGDDLSRVIAASSHPSGHIRPRRRHRSLATS